jgi:serine/threonine protein kinase
MTNPETVLRGSVVRGSPDPALIPTEGLPIESCETCGRRGGSVRRPATTGARPVVTRDAPTITLTGGARQERLAQAIDEFYAGLDAGEPIDRGLLLEKYSDIADELNDCLNNLDFIQQIAPQLSTPASVVGGSHDPAHPTSNIEHPASNAGILGDFRLLRELGRGGMGVVYEAEQISLGRRVALKVLPFAAMLDKQQLARFKNEARAAATLDHPNIVAVHSIGVERGVHYYAMQLIEGQSLAQVVEQLRCKNGSAVEQQNGRAVEQQSSSGVDEQPINYSTAPLLHSSSSDYPTSSIQHPTSSIETAPIAHLSTLPDFDSREYYRSVAHLGIQAAEALDHAHQNGILHRDIKPANLLVECSHLAPRDGRDVDDLKLWITDFGLARLEADAGMTMTGDLVGTLRYMSPEQALAKRVVVDHRSDVYSLGVTLYELFTLRPAYEAEDRQELLRQIAFDEPRQPRQVNARLPQDLETIVLKSIEKNPADRYTTAQELADDLRRFVDDRPITARRPSLGSRAHKWARRHVTAIAAAALVMLLATIGLAVAAAMIGRERSNALANAQRADENRRQAERALQESQRQQALAEQSAAENEALVKFFVDDLLGAIEPTKSRGEDVTVAEIVEAAEQKLSEDLGNQPLLEAKIRSALAKLNKSLSRYARAEEHWRVAAELQLAALGITRESLATRRGLAATLMMRGHWEQATAVNHELIRQRESVLGPNHEETFESMHDLAVCLRHQHEYDESNRWLQTIAERAQHVASPDRERFIAYVKVEKALLAEAQGDLHRAKQLAGEVLALGESAITADDALNVAWHLGKYLHELDEFDEARETLSDVVAGCNDAYGPAAVLTLNASSTLARTLFEITRRGQGDHLEQARELIRTTADNAYKHQQWDSLFYACWVANGPKTFDPAERAKFKFLAAIALAHAEGTYVNDPEHPDLLSYYVSSGEELLNDAAGNAEVVALRNEARQLLQNRRDKENDPPHENATRQVEPE